MEKESAIDERPGFWRETLYATVFALLIFIPTAARFAFPGASARLMAEVAGLVSPGGIDLPAWRLLMGGIARIPFLSLPWRLNLANAIIGAVAAGAIFRFVALFIIDFLPIELSRPFLRRAALVGGAAATLGLIFSASGWSMASHLSPAAFELAVAAICLNLADDATREAGFGRRHFAAAFLAGLCMVGSGGIAIFAPFLLLSMLVRLYLVNDELRWGWTCGVIMSAVAGAALAFAVSAALFLGGMDGVGAFLPAVFSGWGAQLAAQFPEGSFFLLVCLGCLPLAVMMVIAGSALSRRDLGLGFIVVLMTLLAGASFMGFPWSPWHLAGRHGSIPMLPLLCLATVCGFVTVFWFERRSRAFNDWTSGGLEPMSGEKSPDDDDDDDDDGIGLVSGPFFGWAFMAAGAACVVFGAIRHFHVLHLGDGAFLDTVAERIVAEDAQGEGWLDPAIIEPHLLIARRARPGRRRAADDGLSVFDAAVSIDDYRWVGGLLGPRGDCACVADEIQETLRSRFARGAVDSGVRLLKAGEDKAAADVFREIALAEPGNLSAFANWASMFNDGHVREGFMASQELESLKNSAAHLLALHGQTLAFGEITGAMGEIVDPDAIVSYGFEFTFPHDMTRSPGYDAWDDDAGDVTQRTLSGDIVSPHNSALPQDPADVTGKHLEKVELAANNALRAHEALRIFDVKTAREYFKRSNLALANAPALIGTAKCLLTMGDSAAAEKAIGELFAFNGGKGPELRFRSVAWNLRSIAMLEQGRAAEAVEAARNSISDDGGMASAGIYPRLALARALVASGTTGELREVTASLLREIDGLPGEMRSEVIYIYRATR